MRRINNLPIERIILILFSVLPIIDSVNGILVTNGLFSIGIVYKVLILGLLLLFCLASNDVSLPIVMSSLIIVAYIGLSVALNIVLFSGELHNVTYPLKLIFNVMTLALLFNCARAGQFGGKTVYTILDINAWLMIAVILTPYILGAGYTIYTGGIGYKGFFYSQNELSISLLILFYFCLYKLSRRFSVIHLGQVLGIAVCVLLMSNKTSIVGVAAGVALFMVEFLIRCKSKYKWLIFVPIAAALFLAKDFLVELIGGFLKRQFLLHDLYNGSLLDTLVSGRTFKLEAAWQQLVGGPAPFLRTLIGNGFCSSVLVEMDFLDLFFYLGLIGVAAISAVLVWFFIKSLKNFKADGTLMRPLGYLMTMGFAFLAGHTLFMATSGCYFVLFLCFCLMYRSEEAR